MPQSRRSSAAPDLTGAVATGSVRARLPGAPSGALVLGLLAAAAAGWPAPAGNWTLGGGFSQSFEADSNVNLSEDGEPIYGTRSSVDLSLGYQSRRTAFSLGSGISFTHFVGPGDTDGLNGLSDPRLTASLVREGKRNTVGAEFGFVTRPVSYTLTDEVDGDIVNAGGGDAQETAAQASAFWTRRLDGRNSISFTPSVSVRRFSDDEGALTPSTTYGITTGWSRALDNRSSGGLNFSLRRVEQDGPDTETESTIMSLGASFSRRLTPRHGFSVNLGVSRAMVEETTDFGFFTVEEDRTSLGFDGALSLDWAGPGRTNVGLEASQGFEPGADGGLDLTTRVGAAVSRPLTNRASAGLVADLTRRVEEDDDGGDGAATYSFSFGPRLDYEITREWSAGLGLTYRRREDDDGGAGGTRVFFQLSRPLEILR